MALRVKDRNLLLLVDLDLADELHARVVFESHVPIAAAAASAMVLVMSLVLPVQLGAEVLAVEGVWLISKPKIKF